MANLIFSSGTIQGESIALRGNERSYQYHPQKIWVLAVLVYKVLVICPRMFYVEP